MKKCFLILSIILSFCFIGCGKINVSTRTNINEKGEAKFILKAIYDDEIKNQINNSLIEKNIKMNNVDINKYTSNGLNVEEITINFDNSGKLVGDENIYKVLDYKVVKKDYFYESIYDISITISKNIFNLRNKYNEKSQRNYIDSIPYSNTIMFPGELISTNATEHVSPNEVKWNYKLGQLNDTNTMTLTYKVTTIWKLIFISIIIIFIILGIIISLHLKNKRKRCKRALG